MSIHMVPVMGDSKTRSHVVIQVRDNVIFGIYIQGVPGGMDKISGECSLC